MIRETALNMSDSAGKFGLEGLIFLLENKKGFSPTTSFKFYIYEEASKKIVKNGIKL